MKPTIQTTLFFILVAFQALSCDFGDGNEVNAGTITPTVSYQTVSNVRDGKYYSVSVTCGNTYNFNFCNNGGTASWDTQITLLATDGTTELSYNDDNCGVQSNVIWYASFTGTIYVLITEYSCNFTGNEASATLAYNMTVGTVDPSFNLVPTCGGGLSSITGTTGGTFAFNPAPGDGTQLNATTGVVSNGNAGTTYFVEYTVCSSSSIETITVIDEDCFSLSGTAQYINVSGEDCIQLTEEVNSQTGCAWSGSQIDFNSNFSLTLDYYFGNNISGADGNTFTFQPSSSTACGQAGTQLGAGGIPNALVVEFDTYDNGTNDMVCDHIAIETDGNMQNGTPLAGPVCAKSGGGNIDDGGTYEVEIVWNATTHQLDIYFNGALRLSCSSDFVNTIFGGQNLVYWGATSATGGLNNQQYFCPSSVVVLPVELSSFTTFCEDDKELFEWTTASENRVDYFQLEYTYDGSIYFPVGQINAFGNSTSEIKYSMSILNNDLKQRYYRLKVVDENGDFEHTNILSGMSCSKATKLISTIYQKNNALFVDATKDVQVTITNQLGQVVFNNANFKTQHEISTISFSQSIYFININAEDGDQESKKVILMN